MKTYFNIVFVIVVAFLMVACTADKPGNKSTDSLTDSLIRPDSELSTAKIQLFNKGEVVAEIDSEKIRKFNALDSSMAYNLEIHILDSAGVTTSHIVGDSGVIRELKGVLHIYGNVVVDTEDDTKLETEYLWWDSKTDRIKSDAFVKITQNNDIITGWGLDADNGLNSFKILNQVSGEVTDPNKLEESGN